MTPTTSTPVAHLSLMAAILININIMLGSGIFINSVNLAQKAGVLSALVYPLIGLLLIPLIVIFSLLLRYIPGGTFYEFGASINPFVGFISSWGYFTGKLASAALSIHVSVTTIQLLLPAIREISPFLLDTGIIGIFLLLNTFNIKTERPVQYLFVTLKSIPIFIALGTSYALFSRTNITQALVNWSTLPATIPFALFAFAGFEASCSLSKSIKDSPRNGPRAITISYFTVLLFVSLYQLGLFGALGTQLAASTNFQEPFAYLILPLAAIAPFLQKTLLAAAFIGIASSALGASYGILYSNVWNMHTIATYNMLPFAKKVKTLNRFQAPLLCIMVAGILMASYLYISNGYIIALQQISACAATLCYTISSVAFTRLAFRSLKKHRILAILALSVCGVFVLTTLSNAISYGIVPYLWYISLLLCGVMLFFITLKEHTVPATTKVG